MADPPEIRDQQGRFPKGVSGNPGGRPSLAKAMREAAQAHGPDAVKGLLALATNADANGVAGKGNVPHAVRRQAWVDLLDRGFGKPTVGEPDDEGGQRQVMEIITGIVRGKAE